MSGPSKTNPRGAGVCLPPLVGLPRPPRVRVGRLQKGRLVGPEGADAVASVARAVQRGRWSRLEHPGFSQESGSGGLSGVVSIARGNSGGTRRHTALQLSAERSVLGGRDGAIPGRYGRARVACAVEQNGGAGLRRGGVAR